MTYSSAHSVNARQHARESRQAMSTDEKFPSVDSMHSPIRLVAFTMNAFKLNPGANSARLQRFLLCAFGVRRDSVSWLYVESESWVNYYGKYIDTFFNKNKMSLPAMEINRKLIRTFFLFSGKLNTDDH